MKGEASPQAQGNRRDIDRQLDVLEARIAELRIQYEQYFVDVVHQAPEKLHKEVTRTIKQLLKAPFKNSANKFRLRTLITRFQTYQTYWERVNKQREEGTYFRDVFKADMREKMTEEEARAMTQAGAADKGMQQLFSSYEQALTKAGCKPKNLDYNAFRQSLVNKARTLKQKHGVKKLSYKVVVKNGKVTVKASKKK